MVDRYAPGFWYAKAEDTLAQAAAMHDRHARRTMLQIAIMYMAMALRCEGRSIDHRGNAL